MRTVTSNSDGGLTTCEELECTSNNHSTSNINNSNDLNLVSRTAFGPTPSSASWACLLIHPRKAPGWPLPVYQKGGSKWPRATLQLTPTGEILIPGFLKAEPEHRGTLATAGGRGPSCMLQPAPRPSHSPSAPETSRCLRPQEETLLLPPGRNSSILPAA